MYFLASVIVKRFTSYSQDGALSLSATYSRRLTTACATQRQTSHSEPPDSEQSPLGYSVAAKDIAASCSVPGTSVEGFHGYKHKKQVNLTCEISFTTFISKKYQSQIDSYELSVQKTVHVPTYKITSQKCNKPQMHNIVISHMQ